MPEFVDFLRRWLAGLGCGRHAYSEALVVPPNPLQHPPPGSDSSDAAADDDTWSLRSRRSSSLQLQELLEGKLRLHMEKRVPTFVGGMVTTMTEYLRAPVGVLAEAHAASDRKIEKVAARRRCWSRSRGLAQCGGEARSGRQRTFVGRRRGFERGRRRCTAMAGRANTARRSTLRLFGLPRPSCEATSKESKRRGVRAPSRRRRRARSQRRRSADSSHREKFDTFAEAASYAMAMGPSCVDKEWRQGCSHSHTWAEALRPLRVIRRGEALAPIYGDLAATLQAGETLGQTYTRTRTTRRRPHTMRSTRRPPPFATWRRSCGRRGGRQGPNRPGEELRQRRPSESQEVKIRSLITAQGAR